MKGKAAEPPLKASKRSVPFRIAAVGVVAALLLVPKSWSTQLLFTIAGGGTDYVYGTATEDPRIDVRELNLGADDRILTVVESGDNALDFLIQGAEVTAVDLNPAAVYLAELKAAACKLLDHASVFAIFGESNATLLHTLYVDGPLRDALTPGARDFWDTRITGSFPSSSWYYTGYIGYAWMFVRPMLATPWGRKVFPPMLDVMLEWAPGLFSVPSSQMDRATARFGMASFMLDNLMRNVNDENYFWKGLITGSYALDVPQEGADGNVTSHVHCAPRFLQPEGFAKVQAALRANKLTLRIGTVAEIAEASQAGAFTAASIQDHCDWMDDDAIEHEVDTLRHALVPHGRLLWRSWSGSVHPAFNKRLMGVRACNVTDDRFPLYGSTWVGSTA